MLSHVKRLINWARSDAVLPVGIERPTVIREIETHYVIGGNGMVNGAIARPRNKDTCRGDAPPAAVFDEVRNARCVPRPRQRNGRLRFYNVHSGLSLRIRCSKFVIALQL